MNPVGHNAQLLAIQKNLINTKPEAVILDSLMDQSPLMDSTMFFMLNSTTLSNPNKITILLRQGNLSNPVLTTFIAKFGPSPLITIGFNPVSVIQQQSYLSDEVLSAVLPKVTNRWSGELLEAMFLKNEYLSDPVLQEFTGTGVGYFNSALFTKILSKQPQFSETVIEKIIKSRYLIPADLSTILKNQVISEANYSTLIGNSAVLNNTIVEIIESGGKYPTAGVFDKLMTRTPAFTEAEMERIIEVTDRDIEPAVLTGLISKYGLKPFLVDFVFRGNPLDVFCPNPTLSNWDYIETKTSYEYYEADYRGTSNGKAYKTLMSLEDIPGRTVSFSDGPTKTISSLRLKHEPSWQVFSVTNTSTHLPTAKDEKQFFYLFDLKNRYDRYWYNYDIQEVNGETTPFDYVLLNNDLDTVMFNMRWDCEYIDAYLAQAPVLPKYDGMAKSRQYAMRTTPFQQMHVTKNQRDAKELRKSEYYFYDSRWVVDQYSRNETALYNGPSCPPTGTPPVNPVSCASCVRWKYGTEADFLAQLPFNYCLWKDPVIGYFACPSSVNYAACNNGVVLVDCNPTIPVEQEEGGPAQMIILTDALKKTLQLRSVVIQVDTVQGLPSKEFNKFRFDRKNTLIADFYMRYDGTDDQNFIRPFKMLYPFDTLVTTKVHKRNQHMQPALISNSVGLLTKFYYNTTVNKWNVNTSCTNPAYSFNYNYSSVDMRNIGLPVRVTVGYLRSDSLSTTFEYTNDGQVKKMKTSSGHTMEYAFDGFNRLTRVTENEGRLLSKNEYQLWKHGFGKSFEERTRENYVYSVLYQHETDTLDNREFQKAFLDPLGRTAGVVRAYRGEGNVQISSGSIGYDNWGRAKLQRKSSLYTDQNPVTALNPILYQYNSGSALYYETKFDHDPASLDTRISDPGIAISDPQNHVIRKQTWIANSIYMSCELGLSGAELKLIMNSGATGAFRFLRASVKDQDGKETITYTNAFGQTVATLSWSNIAEKVVTLYVYDSYGNLSKTINARRQNTDYQYNLMGQLIRETNVDGGEKRYIYNKHGKISGIQDQVDRAQFNEYNMLMPRFRKFEYDIYGNLRTQALVKNLYHINPFCFENKTVGSWGNPYTDSQGHLHYFEYVFSNRMTQDWLNDYKTIDPVNWGPMATSGLPAVGGAATVTYEKTMSYGTDQNSPSTLGKLIESYSCGPTGVAIQKITYAYNSEDLLASQVILQHPTNVNTNDQYLVKATIHYPKYNLRGSLLEEKLDLGSDGSTEMKYFYAYDELNRLKEVSAVQADVALANATKMVDYKYDDALGLVVGKRYYVNDFSDNLFAHQKISYVYDNRNRLTQIGSELFNEWLYYDNTQIPVYNNQTSVNQSDAYNGNVKGTKVKYHFAGTTNSSIPYFSKETIYGYQYDGLNRLVAADALVGDFIDAQFANPLNLDADQSYLIGDEKYSYDKIGNLITLLRKKPGASPSTGVTVEDFVYTYANGNNRLTKVADQATTTNRNYSYDANGNLLTDDYRHIDATVYGRSSYAYNITKGTDQISYLYDGADQRIFKKVVTSIQTTQEMYVKDALGRDLAILKFEPGGVTKEFYVYGNERVALIVPNTLGTTPSLIQHNEATYFLTDHLGNTRVAYMPTPTSNPYIINAVDYYPYGKVLREYDNGAGDRYLSTQHERDKETGLDYRGARYYDSDVARFLSLDPLAAKYPMLSAYNYVGGNPVVFIDPDGKRIVYSGDVSREDKKQIKREIRHLRRESDTYNKIYKDLKRTKDVYTITTGDKPEYDEITRTIHINLKSDVKGVTLGNRIAHETGHAWRQLMGLDIARTASPYKTGSIEDQVFQYKIKHSKEFEATHIENVVRSEMGEDLREGFGTLDDFTVNDAQKNPVGEPLLVMKKALSLPIGKDSNYDYQNSSTNHYEKAKERKHNVNEINVNVYENYQKYN
ncbi:RHS Repeat protein [compost metagenome]